MLCLGYAPLVMADKGNESEVPGVSQGLAATAIGYVTQEVVAPNLVKLIPGVGMYAEPIVAGVFYPLAKKLTPGSEVSYVIGSFMHAMAAGLTIKFGFPSKDSLNIGVAIGVAVLSAAATEKLCQLVRAAYLKLRGAGTQGSSEKTVVIFVA